jgi:hypothetical protein
MKVTMLDSTKETMFMTPSATKTLTHTMLADSTMVALPRFQFKVSPFIIEFESVGKVLEREKEGHSYIGSWMCQWWAVIQTNLGVAWHQIRFQYRVGSVILKNSPLIFISILIYLLLHQITVVEKQKCIGLLYKIWPNLNRFVL